MKQLIIIVNIRFGVTIVSVRVIVSGPRLGINTHHATLAVHAIHIF